ncbi:serine/threonine-protein phosphatase [Candidatus Poribacteria bacterium]|nr:serine/threonine-protein phosphatase [Candidatus Poribacteria bacterium]
MNITLAYHTDQGKLRARNEDRGCAHRLASIPLCVLAVADGMGGHEGGEIASTIAIEVVERRVGELDRVPDAPLQFLTSVVHQANASVYQTAQQEGMDMGTTLTVGLLVESILFIAHVGDSRVYRITKRRLQQLTQDHSWVAEQLHQKKLTWEEAKVSPYRNMVTRFVGSRLPPEVAFYEHPVQRKETYLFCTDGLHSFVSRNAIHQCVLKTRHLERLSHRLVRLANKAGGEDNITVALLRAE